MMMGRNWLFRVSICANLFVLIYLALYSTTTTNPTSTTPIDVSPASLPNIPLSPSQTQAQQQQPPLPPPSSDNDINNSNTNFNNDNEENGFSDQASDFSAAGSSNSIIKSQVEVQQQQAENNENQPQQQLDDPVVIDDPVEISNDKNKFGASIVKDFPSSRESVHDLNSNNVNNNVNNEAVESDNNNRLLQFDSSIVQDSNLNFNRKFSSSSTQSSFRQLVANEPFRQKLFPCDDTTPLRTHIGQRGPFWVLYNYFPASKSFLCDESVTLTTHADFTFLDNLTPLLRRWQGPISLTLYAPGTDFNETLARILYLRECNGADSVQIKELVSFHIFFDYKHIPKQRIVHDPTKLQFNCSAFFANSNITASDTLFGENLPTYKKLKKLPYPVNVARNVAREMVTTHHILASDIELYPNPNLIQDFLDMLRRNDSSELQRPNPNKLYVLSIFEVQANVTSLPADKNELVYMLRNKSAIPFHKYVCSDCHRIPKANEWISSTIKTGLNIFHVGKRKKPFQHWEPIYIGSRLDPMYDERLTWEGRSDKMTQGYVLCVLDYEFHILDNAFLVHRPGIKTSKMIMIPAKNPVVAKQNAVIAKIIVPELKLLYGTRPGCAV